MSVIFLANQAINPYAEVEPAATCEFYLAGTNFTQPLNVYYDDDRTIDAGTFITADAAGLFRPVYISPQKYAIRFKDSSGTVLPYDIDPYYGTIGGGAGVVVDIERYPSLTAWGKVAAVNEELIGIVLPITLNLQLDSGKIHAVCDSDFLPSAGFVLEVYHNSFSPVASTHILNLTWSIGDPVAVVTPATPGATQYQVTAGSTLTIKSSDPVDATAANFMIVLHALEV